MHAHACMSTHMQTRVSMCTHTHMHAYPCSYMHAHIHTHMYACTPMRACKYIYVYAAQVRVLARVQHPNVVRLFGVCLQPVVRVVLPLADGSLRDAISVQRDAISGSAAVALLCGIARGMAAIHAHDILHLDLKVGLYLASFFLLHTSYSSHEPTRHPAPLPQGMHTPYTLHLDVK